MDPCSSPHLGCTIQGQLSTLKYCEGFLSQNDSYQEVASLSQENNFTARAEPHSLLITFATPCSPVACVSNNFRYPSTRHPFFLAQISQSRAENAVANFPFITLVPFIVNDLMAESLLTGDAQDQNWAAWDSCILF